METKEHRKLTSRPAPIALFVYNRPNHTRRTLEALAANDLAGDSDLHIYADGAKDEFDQDHKQVRELIRSVSGFNSVTVTERDSNWGLAASIISGVTELVQKEGRVIVVEDDIVTSKGFLRYMNEALEMYQDDQAVMHISGYIHPIDPDGLPETFFYNQASCWGWATWKRAWEKLNTDALELKRQLDKSCDINHFNIEGSYNFYSHLVMNIEGVRTTWAIKWHTSIYLNKGLCLHPRRSLVQNIGNDGSGVSTEVSGRYDHTGLQEYVELVRIPLVESELARRRVYEFNTGKTNRTWGEDNSNKQPALSVKDFLNKAIASLPFLGPKIRENYKLRQQCWIQDAHVAKLYQLIAEQSLKADLEPRLKPYPLIYVSNAQNLHNILHINTHDYKGGAAKLANRLANYQIDNQGLASSMLVANKSGAEPFVEQLTKEDSLKQHVLQGYQEQNGLLDFFHLNSFRIKDHQLFKESDLVHLHNLHGNYFSLFALPELTALKPTVWTLHDMQAITPSCAHSFNGELNKYGLWECPDITVYPAIAKDTSEILSRYKTNIYRNSNLNIVVPSVWLKRKAEESILGQLAEVNLIYHGIDTKTYRAYDKLEARQKLGLPLDKTILLFSADFGTKTRWRDTALLKEISEMYKANDSYLFVNTGGDSEESDRPNVVNVKYIKQDSDMAMYYSAADVFIYPSLADSFSLVAAEAMACQLPVITYAAGGLPEVVEHMKTGYVAPYADKGAFINGLSMLLEDRGKLKEMGHAGRARVEEKFTIQRMASQYLDLYNKVYEQRRKN